MSNPLNTKAAGYGVLAVAALVALYFVWKKGQAAVTAVANVNAGTPYAGTGVIGTVGHAADVATGGILSSVGSWLGNGLYDLTHPAYDPNSVSPDANSPPVAPRVLSNPVQAAPAILPYSYKQGVLDLPTLLGTDQLFTPSASGSGSSGGYVESGGLGSGGSVDTYGYGLLDPSVYSGQVH